MRLDCHLLGFKPPRLVLNQHPVFQEHEIHSASVFRENKTTTNGKKGKEKIIHLTRESGTNGCGSDIHCVAGPRRSRAAEAAVIGRHS